MYVLWIEGPKIYFYTLESAYASVDINTAIFVEQNRNNCVSS